MMKPMAVPPVPGALPPPDVLPAEAVSELLPQAAAVASSRTANRMPSAARDRRCIGVVPPGSGGWWLCGWEAVLTAPDALRAGLEDPVELLGGGMATAAAEGGEHDDHQQVGHGVEQEGRDARTPGLHLQLEGHGPAEEVGAGDGHQRVPGGEDDQGRGDEAPPG